MTAEESYKSWCEATDKKWWKVYNWCEWAELHRHEFTSDEMRLVRQKLHLSWAELY